MKNKRAAVSLAALVSLCFLMTTTLGCQSSEKKEAEKSVAARLELSRQLVTTSEFKQAIHFLIPIAKEDPKNSEIHMLLGLSYLGIENTDAAAEAFRKASEYDSKNLDAALNYGYALILKKQYKQARIVFDKILENGTYLYMERVHANIGLSYLEERRCNLAMPKFEEALRLDPTFVIAHFNLGKCAFRQKKYLDAVNYYKKAVDFCPGCLDPVLELARAYSYAGKKQTAVQELQRVLNGRIDTLGERRARSLLNEIQR